MKKLGMLVLCCVMMLLIAPMQGKGWAAEKTGFVDIREVMLNSDVGKKAAEEFKKIYETNKQKIQEKEAELRKLKDDLEKQRSILTESAYKEKESAAQKMFRDYQLLVKDANEDLQNRDQELSKKILPDILKVVKDIGEKEKFTMILDVSMVPIAYHTKENDLTKRVLDEFNKASKAKR
ncbi:MAG: OmpH family outer membrane protein [Deltaproteobacteria bacterium]|nr:OmpH family outer membrane protein [Deltaproteobacteria bacterium]